MTSRVRRAVAGIGAGGVLGGGMLALALGAAGPAAAQPCPSSSCTVATVTVGSQTTLTDNTAAISWSPASLPTTNTPASGPVSLTISTNDPRGYTASVTADPSFNTSVAPLTNFPTVGNLSVEGTSGSFQTFTSPAGNPVIASDTSSGIFSGTVSDLYDLSIPNTAPGSYAADLNYTVAGN